MKRLLHKRLICAVLVLAMVLSMAGCGSKEKAQVLSQPASGTILSGYAPSNASTLTVTLADTASSVVMLKDSSGTTLLSFFVRSGDTVTVNVPAERMYVHFASGNTWYGPELLFGEDTYYKYDTQITDFRDSSWDYNVDPLSDDPFVEEADEENQASAYVPKPTTAPTPTQPKKDGYIADLGGDWESVHLQDGSFSLNVHALSFNQTVYNCTSLTVNMNVTMNAGTNCKDWQLWGRSGSTFVKLAKIYLPAGDGYVSQTITFDKPVTFDSVAVTPTAVGGYSWSMGLSITDVWTMTY